jgi:hypothetical protein
VTGSTRLKAGTATKLVLNTISTVAMVRLNKVYENLMVDLRATNTKLWDRGARIIATLTGLKKDAADGPAEKVRRAREGRDRNAQAVGRSRRRASPARASSWEASRRADRLTRPTSSAHKKPAKRFASKGLPLVALHAAGLLPFRRFER